MATGTPLNRVSLLPQHRSPRRVIASVRSRYSSENNEVEPVHIIGQDDNVQIHHANNQNPQMFVGYLVIQKKLGTKANRWYQTMGVQRIEMPKGPVYTFTIKEVEYSIRFDGNKLKVWNSSTGDLIVDKKLYGCQHEQVTCSSNINLPSGSGTVVKIQSEMPKITHFPPTSIVFSFGPTNQVADKIGMTLNEVQPYLLEFKTLKVEPSMMPNLQVYSEGHYLVFRLKYLDYSKAYIATIWDGKLNFLSPDDSQKFSAIEDPLKFKDPLNDKDYKLYMKHGKLDE